MKKSSRRTRLKSIIKKILYIYKNMPRKLKLKLNDFMTAKENARKAGVDEFEYTGKDGVKKVYTKAVTSTGMVIYKLKK